jgi:hypothetical protein
MSIILAGNITGVSSLKDRSIKMTFVTQEIDNDLAGELYGMNGKFIKVLVSEENVTRDVQETVESFAIEEDAGKSPSQRLRAILYRNWEKDSEGYKIFNDYCRAKYEVISTHFKKKLD